MRTIIAWSLAFVVALLLVLTAIQIAYAASDGQVPLSGIAAELRPYVVEILASLIAIALAWLFAWLRTIFGLQVEARHREALQSALANGANVVAGRILDRVAKVNVPVASPVMEEGIEYVLKSVPDAVKHFDLSPERVGELLAPKVTPAVASIKAPLGMAAAGV